jgi:hypothetical protein
LSASAGAPQATLYAAQSAASDSGVHPQTLTDPLPPHDWPVPVQPPQSGVRAVPQRSVAEIAPHCAPLFAQSAASDSGVQPHWFGVLPPPQVTPVPEHVPQLGEREAPQLSVAVSVPQLAPCAEQSVASLSGVQPHWLGIPAPPQLAPIPEQPPQEIVRVVPQLSAAVTDPQVAPCAAQSSAFVSGVHPHAFGLPPPPHVTPVPEQLPQETVRVAPQLSVAVSEPQVALCAVQSAASDSAVQPHWFAVPAPPYVTPVPEQTPQ